MATKRIHVVHGGMTQAEVTKRVKEGLPIRHGEHTMTAYPEHPKPIPVPFDYARAANLVCKSRTFEAVNYLGKKMIVPPLSDAKHFDPQLPGRPAMSAPKLPPHLLKPNSKLVERQFR